MKRILAAIDDSDIATSVVTEASALARATNAKVLLLRVLPEFAEPPAPSILEPAGDTRARIAAADGELSLYEVEIPEQHRGGLIVELGDAWKTICRVARERQVDLVLIGAHRYRFSERMLGTTSAKVVNHIDRPVLVVRPIPHPAPSARLDDEHLSAADMERAAARLKAEHGRLEETYGAMLTAYRRGDWLDVQAQWSILEAAIRRHMDVEEREVFPTFRPADTRAIALLVDEHDRLRSLLETLAINIELHSVPYQDMETLIATLREHAAREESGVYRWMTSKGRRCDGGDAAGRSSWIGS